jgi:glutamyl-Q tRNA(Asp) synthetase
LPAADSGRYRGRFAPSPTGPLHFGSLVAAVASYLAARQAGGEWLVRIEDLDPPREVAGSTATILSTLERFGFQHDGPVVYQSSRHEAYATALRQLLDRGEAFECTCSRSEIEAAQTAPHADSDEPRYPGWCRSGIRAPERPRAVRLRVANEPTSFVDTVQGSLTVDVAADVGDFVIRRRDGLYAYQLAVVVDDAAQGITHVVRGADLLASTPRQIVLQRALGLPTPRYAHVPIATDDDNAKLSKSAGAAALDTDEPSGELWRALAFLRQQPPAGLRKGPLPRLWTWATEHWRTEPLCGLRHAPVAKSL